jgi:hypothetical protein
MKLDVILSGTMRRPFTDEFKSEAVWLTQELGRPEL